MSRSSGWTSERRTQDMTVLETPSVEGQIESLAGLPRHTLVGPVDAPVVAVLGGISATRHVVGDETRAGWWSAIAGAGRAIDTDRIRVLGFDFLDGGRD